LQKDESRISILKENGTRVLQPPPQKPSVTELIEIRKKQT
jgi:hypothetical protein